MDFMRIQRTSEKFQRGFREFNVFRSFEVVLNGFQKSFRVFQAFQVILEGLRRV